MGGVQQCLSTTVPKMEKCSTVPKIDDFRHCRNLILFSALLYFGTVERLSEGSTTVPKIISLFNSAENHQFSALLNNFSFSALLYFGTVVLPQNGEILRSRVCFSFFLLFVFPIIIRQRLGIYYI